MGFLIRELRATRSTLSTHSTLKELDKARRTREAIRLIWAITRRAAVVTLVADPRSTQSNEQGRRVTPPTVIVV